MERLKPCPFCGGEVELIKFYESSDGRGDRYPTIKCKCGLEMNLTFEEFHKIRDDSNYTGGYYSENKELWNGMHQKLIDKWNTRKPIDKVVKQLEEEIERPFVDCDLRINGRQANDREIVSCKIGIKYATEIVKGGVNNDT